MGEKFYVDKLRVKINAALNMTFKTAPPQVGVENCRVGLGLVATLKSSDDQETVFRLLSAMRAASASDPAIRDDVQQRLKEIETARKTAEEIAPASWRN